jgi:hypothetical protein
LSVGLSAADGPNVDIPARARGASSVVVATVANVSASFERNQYGDQLIVSHLNLQVEETMKGPKGAVVSMDLEGGSVGDLSLKVSDLPTLNPGERAVFFLEDKPGGGHQPHLRGLGILKLDSSDRVRGSNLSVADIRAMVRGAR